VFDSRQSPVSDCSEYDYETSGYGVWNIGKVY
jgi:hypothetical protein